MRAPLSVLVTALVRRNKKKAVNAREFMVRALQRLDRPKIQVDFRRVTADTFDMMLYFLEHQSWSLEVHSQFGSKLRGRAVCISFHGDC